jgi:hypothetical protein
MKTVMEAENSLAPVRPIGFAALHEKAKLGCERGEQQVGEARSDFGLLVNGNRLNR